MAIGYPINKTDLDNRMGGLILQVRDGLANCVAFKSLLDDSSVLGDDVLTGLGYGSGEITTIRAAFGAMSSLNSIAHAGALPGGPDDYFFNAKHLTGIN